MILSKPKDKKTMKNTVDFCSADIPVHLSLEICRSESEIVDLDTHSRILR